MKKLIIIFFVFLTTNSFPQFTEIKFYPNDSLYKQAISFNQNTIYCLGNIESYTSGKFELYKSIDKGLTWFLINSFESFINVSNFTSFSDSIHITVGKHVISKTSNAFDSIHVICNQFGLNPTTIKSVNRDTILINNKDNFFVSYDGFNTWDTVNLGSLVPKHPFAIDEISIINDSVWIGYLNYDCALIKTTNAGADWHLIKDLSIYSFCYNDVFANFYSENDGILSIENSIYSTNDGCNTIQNILKIRPYSFIEMNAFASGRYYVVTVNKQDSTNIIYYSKNYGAAWDSLIYKYQKPFDDLFNLCYLNDTVIFALTYNGKMFKINMNSVGLNKIDFLPPRLNIYPNPSNNIIIVEVDGINNWEYKIYNHLGKLITQDISNQITERIDISSLSQGFYFLEIFDLEKSNKLIKKIIKL